MEWDFLLVLRVASKIFPKGDHVVWVGLSQTKALRDVARPQAQNNWARSKPMRVEGQGVKGLPQP